MKLYASGLYPEVHSLDICPMQNRAIRFFFDGTRITLPNRSRLKNFLITKVRGKRLSEIGITYVFCTDHELRKINKMHLGHDYFTDIITFNLSNNPRQLLAEIYISVDRVRDNALKYKVTLKNELHRVIFHGILHLMGFKDKSSIQASSMRRKEEEWLKDYFK